MAIKKIGRKVVQDIVPTERRSVRRISTVEVDTDVVDDVVSVVEDEEIEKKETRSSRRKPTPTKPTKKKFSGKIFIYLLLTAVAIVTIAIALSMSYSKATVTVTQKAVKFTVNPVPYTAKKNFQTDELGYEVVTASESLSQTIPGKKGPLVETKAKGTVVVYNNFSPTPQTLVAGTRLSDPNGLIYRTVNTITIPSKKTTPGSVTVAIVADKAGLEYNSNIADLKGDFKIVGYKGTTKYESIYARLKSDVVGGFSGTKVILDEALEKSTIKTLQDSLKETLLGKLRSAVPEKYVMYDTAYNIKFENIEPQLKSGEQGSETAVITVKGTAYGAIFKADTLIEDIAGVEIKKFPSNTYIVDGYKTLDFKISNAKDFSAEKGTPLIFTLSGPITIKGTFPEDKFKQDLLGVSKEDGYKVYGKYPSIAEVNPLFMPFWVKKFPSSVDRIMIEYK